MATTRRAVRRTASRSTPRLRGDLHVHVLHERPEHPAGSVIDLQSSAGKRAQGQIQRLAQETSAEYLAVVYHASSPLHPRVADQHTNGLIAQHIAANVAWNSKRGRGAELLTGIETVVLPDGQLDVDWHVLAHADLVVAARHGGPTQSTQRIVASMGRALQLPHVDVLGSLGRYETLLSASQWEELIRQAVNTGTALGITLRQPIPPVALELAARHRALIALGSDSHGSSYQHEPLVQPGETAATALVRQLVNAGVTPNRILNFWSSDQLQAWLQQRQMPSV